MSGFSKAYFVGYPGGFQGADGLNPILFEILVGDASRQWLEPVYVSCRAKPIGRINTIIPDGPDNPNSIVDAYIVFCPELFTECPSLESVRKELASAKSIDFNLGKNVPKNWTQLRGEAKEVLKQLKICEANFVDMNI